MATRREQDWIGLELSVPARTVSRALRRHGVPYLRECDPLTGERIRASKTTAVRYERDRPGELVHVDVKKVGKIPDGGGWKAAPTPHSTASPRPAECHQRDGRVHLEAGWVLRSQDVRSSAPQLSLRIVPLRLVRIRPG